MTLGTEQTSAPAAPADIFATTHWTVVLAAGKKYTPQSDGALARLCETYWFPLYAYVRRRGHSKEDAEDLTQAFFAKFLEKNYLENLSAERGRFRAFLLASLKHFLANEWDRSQRQKRGVNYTHLSLDWQSADEQFQVAAHTSTPEAEYDREWAVALLARVLRRLEDAHKQEGRAEHFQRLKPFLSGQSAAVPYAEVARNLGMEESAVRVAVHRLRKSYRRLLKEEIAQTLSDPAQATEELDALFAVFRS